MNLFEFIEKYPERPSRRLPYNDDEVRKLSSGDGVQFLDQGTILIQERNVPDKSGDPGCHLWIVDHTGFPFILERIAMVPPLASGCVKHTNLTGGQPASSGGELWFDPADEKIAYLNGCSGRYGPRTRDELEDAIHLVASFGYAVESFGWDADANGPARVRRK